MHFKILKLSIFADRNSSHLVLKIIEQTKLLDKLVYNTNLLLNFFFYQMNFHVLESLISL